mgnify:CR=1 FL=1
MNEIFVSLGEAGRLIVEVDSNLAEIVLLSVRVSLTAVVIASLIGLPLGAAIAVGRFPGRQTLIVALNALMGLPPVVVGLVVYLMLSRAGPLGETRRVTERRRTHPGRAMPRLLPSRAAAITFAPSWWTETTSITRASGRAAAREVPRREERRTKSRPRARRAGAPPRRRPATARNCRSRAPASASRRECSRRT